MEYYRCEKGKENFVGMDPSGVYYCSQENLKTFFKLCIKNNFSILEKPDKEKQKLILDLDSKDSEIPESLILEIVKEVRKIFQRHFYYIICKREESFGVHLHFLGLLVTDSLYKNLTKYLKKKFPIIDTTPFNHFIPGTGKPGKKPYLPVSGDLEFGKFFTRKRFSFDKEYKYV